MENTTSFITNTLSYFSTTVLPSTTENALPNTPKAVFSWYDNILFCVMLGLSALIGIYFGCFGKKQSTSKEYLMGGKEMKVIPIVISLVASHTSGISLMAIPADVYVYGATYWLGVFSLLILAVLTIVVFLPVFFDLQLTSTYEYLGRRFDDRTRKCASLLYGLSLLVYLPIVTYSPALAFSAVTGINVHWITPIVCGVCIFYTTLGGLKAVVWTDTLQFSVTMGALAAVVGLGLHSAGGFVAVWDKAVEGNRLDIFDFDPNPTKRDSFWAILVGLTIHWMAHISINQGCVQKFLSVPTYSAAKHSVIFYCLGMIGIKTICVFTGLIMFKKYSECDPFTTKKVVKNDQLLPYYVLDVAGHIPGLSGLFIAGVFCAALSTLSASLNCVAGTIYEDFLVEWLEKRGSHKTAGYILKIIVVAVGVISTLMVFVMERLGGLMALSIGLGSIAHGPLLGLFTLGVLFPRANGKGAFSGALVSLACMAVIIFGSNYYQSMGLLKYPPKPVSVDGCDFPVNITSTIAKTITQAPYEPLFIFRLSFYWYTMIGATIVLIVGIIVSYMTNKNDPPVDTKLLSPVVRFLLPKSKKMEEQNLQYYSVERALEIVTSEKDNMNK